MPDSASSLLLAGLALRGGEKLLRLAVGRLLPTAPVAAGRRAGGGLAQAAIGTVLTRIAMRSVPGAILVGGAVLAKTLHDRKKAAQAEEPAEGDPDQTGPQPGSS